MNRILFFTLTMPMILVAGHAEAGMPSPLPEDFAQVFRLDEAARHRLQSISFFVFMFVLATTGFWILWNNLAQSFSQLPRLSLVRAACMTLFLGAVFVVVLTMISGARELMTPEAWQKEGLTYTVSPSSADSRSGSNVESSNVSATQVRP